MITTIIDESWIELQTGLYLEPYSFTVGGVTRYASKLHSSEGYCFYDLTDCYYDPETGEQIPEEEVTPEMRIYYQYLQTPITDVAVLTARFVSVPVEEGYEIVSSNNHEVA